MVSGFVSLGWEFWSLFSASFLNFRRVWWVCGAWQEIFVNIYLWHIQLICSQGIWDELRKESWGEKVFETLGMTTEGKGRLHQVFFYRVRMKLVDSIWWNRRRGVKSTSTYLLPWEKLVLHYWGLPAGVSIWDKTMDMNQREREGKWISTRSTGDRSKQTVKPATGVILQSRACDWSLIFLNKS